MSNTNYKIIGAVFIAVCLSTVGGYKVYRHFHRPKYTPPPPRPEVTLTIIPGWNLRRVADYLVKEGMATSTDAVLEFTNHPYKYWQIGFANELESRPEKASLEGYLAPNTYRVYKDATINDIMLKLVIARHDELTEFYPEPFQKSGMTVHEILTLASIIEKEANTPEDMAIVADIFLRRIDEGMALQSCATVNYVTGKNDPGVSAKDKQIDSPYNTYKYPGLPPGPICNPSFDAIKAVLEPKKNNYVYFMSGSDGVMHYAKTLDEHNLNVAKYLK